MNTGGCTVGSRPEERKMDKSKRKRYRIIRTIFGVTIVAAATWFYLGSYGIVASPFAVIGQNEEKTEGTDEQAEETENEEQTENPVDVDSNQVEADTGLSAAVPDLDSVVDTKQVIDDSPEDIQTKEAAAAAVTPTPTPEDLKPSWLIENVPHIYQYNRYPTGCESVSAVQALQYSGIDISVDTFLDDCLKTGILWENSDGHVVGPDLDDAYIGDPRSVHGCGCNAPVIVRAIWKILPGTGCKVRNLTGMELEDLCRDYICQDIPVILWATIGMQEWTDTLTWENENGAGIVTFYTAEHCLVLTGYDDQFYYFSDPASTEEVRAYAKEAVEKAYEKLGCQAVVVLPPDEEEN